LFFFSFCLACAWGGDLCGIWVFLLDFEYQAVHHTQSPASCKGGTGGGQGGKPRNKKEKQHNLVLMITNGCDCICYDVAGDVL